MPDPYICLTPEEIHSKYQLLMDSFCNFYNGISWDDKKNELKQHIDVNELAVKDIIVQVDKRKAYYKVFHDYTKKEPVDELKEAALTAYWLLKYKPFTVAVLSQDEQMDDIRIIDINNSFTMFVILSTIKKVLWTQKSMEFSLNETTIKIMYHAVKNWDLSKESLTLLLEIVADLHLETDEPEGHPGLVGLDHFIRP